MSIAQTLESQKQLGDNQGYWKYEDVEGNIFAYIVRKLNSKGKKYFNPLTFQREAWVYEWLKDEMGNSLPKPIYNIRSIVLNPLKPVLIVEGEKTADAGISLFPGFNVITWMGGAQSIKTVPIDILEGKDVYLFPDNDKPSFDAMEVLSKRLDGLALCLRLVDIRSLGVSEGWDIADVEHGEVDFEDIKQLVFDAKEIKKEFSYPEMSSGQKPYALDVTENLKYLLNYNNIVVKWNMMKRIRDISVPGIKFYQEESENASLTYIIDLAVRNSFNIRRIDKHLDQISWSNVYHPVRDWVKSQPLIKNGILKNFLETVKTTNDHLSHILIKRWMLSAIYSVFSENNFCAQGVLVLQGEPGTHKSTFIMSLAPESMRAIKGGLSLDPSKKDDILTSSEYWIAELGELDATFRKADIARLKSHITNDIDDVRRPHAVRNSKMIRRTVYAATVNESKFLVDTTGNRRWWTVSVTEPIKTRHGLDMQQVWREVYEMYLQGESPFLLENEMRALNEANQDYEMLDPFEEKLQSYFDWNSPRTFLKTSTQILDDLGYDKPTKSETTRMGTILVKMKIEKGTGGMRRSFFMPRLVPITLR